jgi:membrane fusion protein (multidrug efflux system)
LNHAETGWLAPEALVRKAELISVIVRINKSTGAEFALMSRNVVSGEFTWVEQRVPVRIAIEKDDRWPLPRAGLSVRAVISHGAGDAQWAELAAREMANLEARYNRAKE